MASNLPDSHETDFRDYLYVDENRVKTLLAQLQSGLQEAKSEERSSRLTRGFSKILKVQQETGSTEYSSWSFADIYVSMLEEEAHSLGLLNEVTELAALGKNWKRGKLHKNLEPASLVRVNAPTQIIDPNELASMVEKFEDMDSSSSAASQVSSMVRSLVNILYDDQLVLRSLPAGKDEPSCRFTGIITDPSGYLGADRKALFSRLGSESQSWTCVGIINRLSEQNAQPQISQLVELSKRVEEQFSENPESVERHKIESLMLEMLRFFELSGITESPEWPSISMTPIAIYRNIPKANEVDNNELPSD